MMKNQKLFVDVVRRLKLFGEYICEDNVGILLALRYLRSLEVLKFYGQDPCLESMRRLVKENPRLTELKFAHCSLSDCGFAHLYTTLAKPISAVEKRMDACRIIVLEFASVDIQPEGYRMLVALVGEMPQLLQLRVKNYIQNFDKKLLVNAALRLPALQRLLLEYNMVEDDDMVGLAKIRKPLAFRQLCPNYNNVSFKTVEAICRASMDGVLNLERLGLGYSLECFGLGNNREIHNPAIHALTSMLASPVAGSASVLTHLNLSGCGFGLDGITNLLLALSHHKTLTHLNVAWNVFGVGFGDVLAEFLLTNPSVTHLEVGYVHLSQAGVSAQLLTALESNLNLTSLSLVENRLGNGGASAILGALIKRAQVKPFMFVDLSNNGIELEGLNMIADILEGFTKGNRETQAGSIRSVDSANGRDEVDVTSRKRQRIDSSDEDQRSSLSQCDNIVPILELCLSDNMIEIHEGRREYTALIKSIQRCVGHLKHIFFSGLTIKILH